MKTIWLCVLSAALFSCATAPATGIIAARWTPKGRDTVPATMSWESESSTHGRMFTTLGPGGERFQGSYVQVTHQTQVSGISPIVGAWGPVWSGYGVGADPWYWGAPGIEPMAGAAYYSGFQTVYDGKVIATLFGDHSHSMRCRFTLSVPSEGLVAGGVGKCQVSDGSWLDVKF
jgi:hypothetical protein